MNSSLEPLRAEFLGEGTIKLFREWDFEDVDEFASDLGVFQAGDQDGTDGEGTVISIIAIPSYFTATDILGYVGQDAVAAVSYFRVIRSVTPNRQMVLMKFTKPEDASKFVAQYDGKPFNSMEPETCHVIVVNSITFSTGEEEGKAANSRSGKNLIQPLTLQDILQKKPPPPPTPTLKELPTCPVCLERMDSALTGLMTIPCQHTFHCQCLSKWKDDSCPVCRYSNMKSNFIQTKQKLVSAKQSSSSSSSSSQAPSTDACSETGCSETQHLWICLICGNIACGRYNKGHAVTHFAATGHCFAMDMQTQRVWDYAGDKYVHRLITNQSDGKLVELGPSRAGKVRHDIETLDADYSKAAIDEDVLSSKIEAVGLEYSQLLISQLESQREYYEDKLAQSADINHQMGQHISRLEGGNRQLQDKLDDLAAKFQLFEVLIPQYKDQIDLFKLEKRRLTENYKGVSHELAIERQLSEKLSEKIDHLTKVNTDLALEKEDLQEQVNDLMFFLESQEKLKDCGEDVREGTLVIQDKKLKKKTKKK
ncbi:hypothetical protein BABINDRAFT_32137 [Babjeviella inositovora NRRL Y-12698]|uniref:RING-type domain-containing protein n=1 Tax=Babjeviella inositovora NRRL Y-12698 TaxID=984486 RepID=A0A1E3QVA3_9ASCO|nr:uncharacterized protein BABINDRAFT_32137 [Babjeviella inositovora NRRL Y-12698]ODQ81554.1 hypothetical protein BABINDRAFT_32137 [Babjeviella inositovora NRRL Y-12698]